MTDKQLTLEVEQALTGLVKLMKALRFYPKGHPSLRSTIDECMAGFQPMLKSHDSRAIQVNQSGFSLGETKVGETNPALPDLALLLVERRVNQLIFLPDLPPQELLGLLAGLATPAEEIYSIGGLPVFLQNHQVTTIWLNENSLDGAMQKRQELAEKEQAEKEEKNNQTTDPGKLEKSDFAQQLREIIEQLNTENNDNDYQTLIDKLLHLAPLFFKQSGMPGVLRILPLLLLHSQQEERCQAQCRIASSALDHLLTEQIYDQLLMQFKQTSLNIQQFKRLQKFIVTLGTRIAPRLLAQMSKEEDSVVRKRLTTLLGRMGEPLLDLLRETVHSSKWYVVRNAIILLGDLRLESGVSILAGLTTHPDQRIRRALIRSLAMIGGDKTVGPLLKMTMDPTRALRRPAVKALGATMSPEATRPLLVIAQMFDPFSHQTEIRYDAVLALGTLGDKNAVSPLLGLAKRPNIFRLQRIYELRAEIILALGKLGNENIISDLEKWRRSPHGVIQRAAEQSLTALTKK